MVWKSGTLEWNAVENTTSYEIQHSTDGVTWTNISVTGTSITIDDLAAVTEYQFQVRAVNADGKSDWSASVFVTTDTAPKVIVPAKGATTLTWDPVKTVMDNQEIIYVVGVYDSKTKGFKAIPEVFETDENVGVDISRLGLGKIGVQEILKDAVTGNVIAKSAIKVVTVW